MVFCNEEFLNKYVPLIGVTILILIDGFLQYIKKVLANTDVTSHNPYFNRWFSAILWLDMGQHIVKTSQSLF